MRSSRVHLVSSDPAAAGTALAVPQQQTPVVIPAGTLTGSFVTPPVDVQLLYHWSATATLNGARGVGAWQVCNDLSTNLYNPASLVNWVDYPELTTPMSASTAATQQTFWTVGNQAYAWVRFSWTHQGGSGSIDVSFTGKGA